MSIKIPIISDFDSRGVEAAVKQFKSLETSGQKASFLLKKSTLLTTASITALGAQLWQASKAAADDQAAQIQLARQLTASTDATTAQVKANESFVKSLQMTAAVSDDELRPALASLVRGTGDLASAQTALQTVLDVSAATGKGVQEVADAVSKAYGGNTKAIKQLSPELFGLVKDGASVNEVMQSLNGTFGGASAAAANSAQGSFKKISIALQELQETIGNEVLPYVKKLLDGLTNIATWVNSNPGTWGKLAQGIKSVGVELIKATSSFWTFFGSIVNGISDLVTAEKVTGAWNNKLGVSAIQQMRVSDAAGIFNKSLSNVNDSAKKAGGGVDTMKQKIEAARKEIQDKFTKALDEANQKLNDAKQSYQDFSASVSGSITNGVSFSDALSQGTESGKTFLAALKDQADATKQFAGKVKQLIISGLSKQALQQVLDAGTAAGTQIADELIAGGAEAISQANDLLQSVQDIADSVGTDAADKWYAAGVSNAQSYLDAITSTIAQYTQILKNPNLSLKQILNLSDQFGTDTAFAEITGTSSMAPPSSVQDFMAQRQLGAAQQGTVINISGGLSTSSDIAQSVVDALRFYNQNVGPVRISTI